MSFRHSPEPPIGLWQFATTLSEAKGAPLGGRGPPQNTGMPDTSSSAGGTQCSDHPACSPAPAHGNSQSSDALGRAVSHVQAGRHNARLGSCLEDASPTSFGKEALYVAFVYNLQSLAQVLLEQVVQPAQGRSSRTVVSGHGCLFSNRWECCSGTCSAGPVRLQRHRKQVISAYCRG